MTYINAFFDRANDKILVIERNKQDQRIIVEYPAKYTFYYADPKGKYSSIYKTPVSKVSCKNTKEFNRELKLHSGKKLFESDINPINRCLSENYLNAESPKLHVAFWDIETAFDQQYGYSSPDDALNPIISIAVYLQWLDALVCLALPPPTLSYDDASGLIKDIPNTLLFHNESDLLNTFLDLIQDADLLSGWNCQGYDIPYTINRIMRVLSKNDTKRLCLFDEYPYKREYERYGKTSFTYDLVGRINIDSLELYRKYTYEERHSFKLDAIAEYELGDRKTPYDGSLDQLYKTDFKTFIEYNRQDTMLLGRLDKKLKFIDIANVLAHDSTVLIPTTMGAVAVTEQAIINEAHNRGMVVPTRKPKEEKKQPKDKKKNKKKNKNIYSNDFDEITGDVDSEYDEDSCAAGAYVAYPKKGLHDWVGSLDINSLYPSVIRALNMGPDTIVGQVRQTLTIAYIKQQLLMGKTIAQAWERKFGSLEYELIMEQDPNTRLVIDWEDGTNDELTADNIYRLIHNNNKPWVLSANGTIFSYEHEGVVPGLLKRWYSERKELQAELKSWKSLSKGIEIPEFLLK